MATSTGSTSATPAHTHTEQAQMTLTLTPEQNQLSSSVEHALSVLVSLRAPESASTARPALELIAVVDRSGSMSGAKMKAMKEALAFLVAKGLQKEDRFGLVAFDNTVDLRLPVEKMDLEGKKRAQQTVASLTTGGSTNLSGGLLRGIDVLSQATGGSPNANRAVLLFTDGIANNGITDSAGIVSAAQGAMVGSPMTIFTFGFGSDHSESLLRSLSEQSNGLYYYVEKSEDIPLSFADCLGGLVSVVAQNALLRIEGLDGSVVSKVHSGYKQEPQGAGSVALQLGDVYAEDEKDVLLTLTLPPLVAPRPVATVALRATLRYFSVADSRIVEATTELPIGRPEGTPPDQPTPPRLLEQRERILVADAMAQASELADTGRLLEGRQLLQAAVAHAKASPCAESFVVSNIVRDALTVEQGYSDVTTYRSIGSKMSKMNAMSHGQQRSTHSAGVAYERKSKMAMKAMFTSSMPPSPPSPPLSPEEPHLQPQTASPRVGAATKSKKKAIFTMPSMRRSSVSSID